MLKVITIFTQPVIKKRRNGRYGNNNWISYSPKINRNVYLYSDLEYDHWILVEFDKNIKYFCEQPKHVQEYVDGEWIDTIFDMWILTTDNQEKYIEVKYANHLDRNHQEYSERSSTQVGKQRKWCTTNSYEYEVHTDELIYINKLLLNNYKRMLPYIDNRKSKNEMDRRLIINFLQPNIKATIGSVESHFTNFTKHRIRDTIYNLVYEGILQADLSSTEIGVNTEVWL